MISHFLYIDENGCRKVKPVGPWVVIGVDEDDTYELFYLGGYTPHCNVWAYCATKLKLMETFSGKLIEDVNHNLPVFIPDKP